MLEAPVLDDQAAADGADPGVGRVHHHPLDPVGGDHLHVVVEQQQVLALGDRGAVVDLFREAERAVEEDDPEPVAGDLAELGEDLGRGRAVGDDDDLVVVVGRGLDDAADAVGDEDDLLEPDFAAVPGGRDDDADRGPSLEPGDELVDAGVVEVALDPRRQPDPLAVGLERPGPGFERPGLRRFAAAGGGGGEHPPVVEDPRHVGDLPRPLGDPQDQVPVLGALELGVEAADLLDQRAAQDAEVAGVHLGPEPLRRPVGLEERPRVAPAPRRSCLRRCRRSRPRGRRASASSTSASASGCSMSSWSRRTTNSPPAIASASLEAATMPPFSSRRETRIRPSSRAAPSTISSTCGSAERSSTRQSSQSPKRWRRTESSIASRTAAGVS